MDDSGDDDGGLTHSDSPPTARRRLKKLSELDDKSRQEEGSADLQLQSQDEGEVDLPVEKKRSDPKQRAEKRWFKHRQFATSKYIRGKNHKKRKQLLSSAKAPLKPLPSLSSRYRADFPDLEEKDSEDDWGDQAEEVAYHALRRNKIPRKERPETIATPEQTTQFWQAESARLARVELNTHRFAQPVGLDQLKRSVATFRELTSLPVQLRLACCVCGQLQYASTVNTFRLPGSKSIPNCVSVEINMLLTDCAPASHFLPTSSVYARTPGREEQCSRSCVSQRLVMRGTFSWAGSGSFEWCRRRDPFDSSNLFKMP